MKKFLSVLLTLIMTLSVVTLGGTTTYAQDTLVRVPSTIPGTNTPYNYVENVTVKIPGTEATFELTKVADFVKYKENYSRTITRRDETTGEYVTKTINYNIPNYRFTFFKDDSEAIINQDGMWEMLQGNTTTGDMFEQSCTKGATFKIPAMTTENEEYIRNKFFWGYETIINSDNSFVVTPDVPSGSEVARVEFIFINPNYFGFDEYFDEDDYGFKNWDKTMDISDFVVSDNATLNIAEPSQTTINYKDGIILNAEVENIPNGATIEWTADNDNFKLQESTDGTTLTVTSNKNGKTIFTATLYDANGNILSEDTVELTSKAGFLQKFVGFFKSLFGMTKIFNK